ncbi:L,D-transpeptidase [Alsobacter metallidurans]|uniref:L,D-transpeptidase n=1 Tax=Alsobacter metallidurans TaxID=340221 RepID=UPI001667A1D3|nr:L,D-transpeptidase [Alsobacter metallidurans]
MAGMDRRAVVLGALAAAATGTQAVAQAVWGPSARPGSGDLYGLYPAPRQRPRPPSDAGVDSGMYGPVPGEPFPVPGLRSDTVPAAFHRRTVAYDSVEAPGTIIVDPRSHYLYLVNGDGTAIRYGVGVGRSGFGWAGVADIRNKQAWPDWYPPKEMLERQPDLAAKMSDLQSGVGMHGGPGNPLGARALYLWQGNKDTLYRIHGTVEPWTIGKSVSSGCIRMINQDVIDLYDRVSVGARVVVTGTPTQMPTVKAKPRRRAPETDDAWL